MIEPASLCITKHYFLKRTHKDRCLSSKLHIPKYQAYRPEHSSVPSNLGLTQKDLCEIFYYDFISVHYIFAGNAAVCTGTFCELTF